FRRVLFRSVLYLLLAWPLGRVLVSEPEAMGLRPDGEKAAASEAPGSGADQAGGNGAPVGARSALRTREFWLLSVGHGNALAIVGAVSVHFVIYVGETIGLGVTTAAARSEERRVGKARWSRWPPHQEYQRPERTTLSLT